MDESSVERIFEIIKEDISIIPCEEESYFT